MTKTDRYRVISERRTLKKYNEDNPKEIYINEDLTTYRARLFKTTRSLQARKNFKQAWTYNGNIKVTTQNGVVKPISTIDDIKALLPDVDLRGFIWMIITYAYSNFYESVILLCASYSNECTELWHLQYTDAVCDTSRVVNVIQCWVAVYVHFF